MESTVFIALITACAAIAAPVITAVINNKNELKKKQIEAEQYRVTNISLHEREILEKGLAGIGIMMSWKDQESIKEACKSILIASAYVDDSTGLLLMNTVNSAMDADGELTIQDYLRVCVAMKEEIAIRTLSNNL